MFTKENLKFFTLLAFLTIIMYKLIDSPSQVILQIKNFTEFFSPFLIAILITLLINPLMMYFEKNFKLHRLASIFISFILISFALSVAFKIILPIMVTTLNSLILEIPNYVSTLNSFSSKYLPQNKTFELLTPHIQYNINIILKKLLSIFSQVSSDIFIYIFSLTSLLFDIIIGIILSIYILFEKEIIANSCKTILYTFTSEKRSAEIIEFFKISHSIFYNFLVGQLLDSFIVSIIAFLVFEFIIKIDNTLFLTLIIFITNMIPYFGPIIGATFPIFMTLIYNPMKSFWVLIFLLILQQIDANLIGPHIMGEKVGLDPLWIISSILIGGSLFGFVGVFLSVPFAAILKYLLDKYIGNKSKVK